MPGQPTLAVKHLTTLRQGISILVDSVAGAGIEEGGAWVSHDQTPFDLSNIVTVTLRVIYLAGPPYTNLTVSAYLDGGKLQNQDAVVSEIAPGSSQQYTFRFARPNDYGLHIFQATIWKIGFENLKIPVHSIALRYVRALPPV